MKYHVLIPVKSLESAKSRLAKNLLPQERKQLVLHMLDHVLSVLLACKGIEKVSIVTSDREVIIHAESQGAKVIREAKQGHNPALSAAALQEKLEGVEGLITISADLPLLTSKDIHHMLQLATKFDIVLSPSKDQGTNAILVHSPLTIPYLFGENSFKKYVKNAKKRKISVGICESKTLAFDVDTAEDLFFLTQLLPDYKSFML